MSTLELVEAAIVERMELIDGIARALDHEPDKLPPPLPIVTLLWIGQEQDDRYTGSATENANRWQLSLYVSLSRGWRDAQVQMKALWHPILHVFRVDPGLGGAAEWTRVIETMEPPEFDAENKHVRKSIFVVAVHEET
jgi:hypothetical protein